MTEMAPAGLHRSMVQFRGSDLATAGPTGWRVVVVLESARRSLSSCSNQLVARAWLGTIDVLRSLETLREFSHTSLPAFSVDLGVQNFGISKFRISVRSSEYLSEFPNFRSGIPEFRILNLADSEFL